MNRYADSTTRSDDFEDDIRLATRSTLPVLISASPERALEIARDIAARFGWTDELLVCDFAARDPLWTGGPEGRQGPGGYPRIVLLREVHALTPDQQGKLMRLIADRRARPEQVPCIIASSSVSLFDCVKRGTFDERLFYRLNTIHIAVAGDDALDDDPQSLAKARLNQRRDRDRDAQRGP